MSALNFSVGREEEWVRGSVQDIFPAVLTASLHSDSTSMVCVQC